MTEAIETVTTEVMVPLSRKEAFELFTGQFGHWWPRDYSYSGEVLAGIELGRANLSVKRDAPPASRLRAPYLQR